MTKRTNVTENMIKRGRILLISNRINRKKVERDKKRTGKKWRETGREIGEIRKSRVCVEIGKHFNMFMLLKNKMT